MAEHVCGTAELDHGGDHHALNPAGPEQAAPILCRSDFWGHGQAISVRCILVYLADRSGRFLATDPARRYETLQWLMFQMGGVGPMFGQLGFFHKFAGKEEEDKCPRDRYVAESTRLLKVLEQRLASSEWLAGSDYSIADIAVFPWVRNLVGFYGAGELVGFDSFGHVKRALDAFVTRPAVQRGLQIPPR